MTTGSKLILVALVAFLGGGISGGIAGGYAAVYFTSRFFADGGMLGRGSDVQGQVGVLQRIRDGRREEAIEYLESALDANIMTLQISENNTDNTNQTVARALQAAKEYRARYPRRTENREVDELVAETLGGGVR